MTIKHVAVRKFSIFFKSLYMNASKLDEFDAHVTKCMQQVRLIEKSSKNHGIFLSVVWASSFPEKSDLPSKAFARWVFASGMFPCL